MALLPGSPAIDAGALTESEWDQRGPGYPRLVHGVTDIGAYEVQDSVGGAAVATPGMVTAAVIGVPAIAPNQASVPTPTLGRTSTPLVPLSQATAVVDQIFATHTGKESRFLVSGLNHDGQAPADVSALGDSNPSGLLFV
jgi:hypothetical protein